MADIVAERLGIPKASARAVVSEFLVVLREQLVQRARIRLVRTATISTYVKSFRLRNRQTGDVSVEDRLVLSIKPASSMRALLNTVTRET